MSRSYRKNMGRTEQSLAVSAVVYANPDWYPPIINAARYLDSKGIRLSILCRAFMEHWDISYPSRTLIHKIDTKPGSTMRQYLRFIAQVLRHADRSAEVFIGYDMHGLLAARLLAFRHRRPVAYYCLDYAEKGRKLSFGARAVKGFEQIFARTASLVIVPDAERAVLIKRELRLKKLPIVVANAPPGDRALPDGAHLQQALAERGFHFDKIVFRQGSLGPYHAIEATLRSMPFWERPSWGFAVMGEGEPGYKESLVRLAEEVGVANRFAILPPVGYDDVVNFTVGADVGHGLYVPVNVNHRHATTASNKIMEYMAAGLALLVSDTPALRGLVGEYQCGATADERSPESIAASVNGILGDPERARSMGAAGRRAFEQHFCFEKQFAPALAALLELARPRRDKGQP